jgi:Family of unknown function (DUF5695)/Bacterial Ig domain
MDLAEIYFNMYRISKLHGMTSYLTDKEYLLRAYNTLMAMYTVSTYGDGANKWGLMDEADMPNILKALHDEGYISQSANLAAKYLVKAKYMTSEKYPFGSEMPYDTTGYESAYAAAKFYSNAAVVERVKKATVATRGSVPVWYHYGTDLRWMGDSWWNVSYESQLGGELLQDYAKNNSTNSAELLRLAYGSYIVGFSNINSGQISSDPANKYATSWVYQSALGSSLYSTVPMMSSTNGWWAWSGEADLGLLGGMRMAASDVVDDAVFGLMGYGSTVSKKGNDFTVIPKDGIRQRLNMFNLHIWMELQQDKYTKAIVAKKKDYLELDLENRKNVAHTTQLSVNGLNIGNYEVLVNGKKVGNASVGANKTFTYKLSIGTESPYNVKIVAKRNSSDPTGENTPPVVYAAEDTSVKKSILMANLLASISDDGPQDKITSIWSLKSGPTGGQVSFANENSANTTATFNKSGTYVLTLTVSDGELKTAIDVTVTADSNLALSATPKTSYVSPWEKLDAINDGYDPKTSTDKTGGGLRKLES